MRIFLLLLTLMAIVFAKDPYRNIHYKKLSNGLEVYLLSDKKASQTYIDLTVKDGTLAENEQNTGIAHLTEHMIFRDSRLKYKDYLDLFKNEGASCNGYTSRSEVEYYVTLDANKSYWALKNFYNMIFNKKWNQEDLKVEKKAVLNEIGEPHWWNRLAAVGKFINKLFPPKKSFYQELFDVNKSKETPPWYLQKFNTPKFTLDDVKKHYSDYYYPKNMVLQVIGNFDEQKMWELIDKTFGTVKRDGNKTVKKDKEVAKLKGKEYSLIRPGVIKNRAEIGGRFIEKDYKTYLINQIYIENLANRLQRTLRNKEGKSYSIYGDTLGYKKASVAYVVIDGLHKDFKNNIKTAIDFINKDSKNLDTKTYKEAMSEYKKYYFEAIEHDTDTLSGLVNQIQYLKEEHNVSDQTPYTIFNQITPQQFQKTIANTFKKENRYRKIFHDYLLFPYDTLVIVIISIIGVILMFKYLVKQKLLKKGIFFSKDDITLQRRVTSRFVSFFIVAFVIFLAILAKDWINYILFETSDTVKYKISSLPLWFSYLMAPVDLFIFALIYVYTFKLLFKNYRAALFLTGSRLYLSGSEMESYAKSDIKSVSVEKYSPKLFNKIRGVAMRFWKPLVKIALNNGKALYIRAANAEKLKENLENWLKS